MANRTESKRQEAHIATGNGEQRNGRAVNYTVRSRRRPASGRAEKLPRGWRSVSKTSPCPVCGHDSWCSVALDGKMTVCRRQEVDSYASRTDANGAPYYLHRTDGEPCADGARYGAGEGAVRRAPPSTCHEVYSALLNALGLSDRHRADLRRRGLTDEQIDARRYRSLGGAERHAAIVPGLAPRVGGPLDPTVLLSVPGIIEQEHLGTNRLTLSLQRGLVIPVTDSRQYIVALKVRLDRPGDGPKYVYLSSTRSGGPGPGSPVHFPPFGDADVTAVRITEGELKADVCCALTGVLTFGAPGVGGWRAALAYAQWTGVPRVLLAFDSDAWTNLQVAQQLLACARAVREAGLELGLETWGGRYKGLDDLLVAGETPALLLGDKALKRVRKIVDRAKDHALPDGGARPALTDSAADLTCVNERTEVANAARFVREHGPNLRFASHEDGWRVWDGKRWAEDQTFAAKELAISSALSLWQLFAAAAPQAKRDALGAMAAFCRSSNSDRGLTAVLNIAKTKLAVPRDQFDMDPFLLNVRNGTVDLRTGELHPHRREDLITKLAPVDFDPDAQCPLWLECLLRWMGEDQELVDYLQRVVGYALTGDVSEQCLWFLHGNGANGKSTFLGVLLELIGDYSMQAVNEMLMQRGREVHLTERADLAGARLVATIETEEGKKMAEALVKQLTGGDKIRARKMKRDHFQFNPTHKLFLAANHKPVIGGADDAIWRRINLVPFTVQIPAGERDPKLPKKLLAQGAGILAWAVRGCLQWQKNGLQAPQKVRAATASYRQESDLFAEFIAECCVLDPKSRVLSGGLLKAYNEYAKRQPLTRNQFAAKMKEKGFESRLVKAGTAWLGICLRTTGGKLDDDGG